MESQKRSVVVGRVGTSGYVRWLPIICFASCLHAESGKVLERRPAVFHKYREVQGIDKYATEAEYRAVVNDTSFVLERVEYTSDDIAVVAYLYRPQWKPESAMPAIIFNRGGFRDTDVSLYLPSFHRFAKAGFVVLAPMLRQSEGASGIDELGGRDVHDVLSIVSLLSSFEFIDRNNLFLAGESRGGMMILQPKFGGWGTVNPIIVE